MYSALELFRSYLAATGQHRALVQVTMPGGAARSIRNGANLAPDGAVGRRTWEFLAGLTNPSRAVAA